MTSKNVRFDYPGQCHNPALIKPFPTTLVKSQTKDTSRVLVVTKAVSSPFCLSPAIQTLMLLAEQNIRTDLLILIPCEISHRKSLDALLKRYGVRGEVIELPRHKSVLQGPMAEVLELSFHLDVWLTELEVRYSLIAGFECSVDLYYPLLSRSLRLELDNTNFVVFERSSSYFESVKSASPVASPLLLNRFFIEQRVAALADSFISNSQHFLNWLFENSLLDRLGAVYCQDISYSIPCKTQRNPTLKTTDLLFIIPKECMTELDLCIESIRRLSPRKLSVRFIIPKNNSLKVVESIRQAVRLNNLEVDVIRKDAEKVDWVEQIEKARAIVLPNLEKTNSIIYSMIKQSNTPLLDNGPSQQERAQAEALSIRTFVHNPEIIKNYLEDFLSINSQGYIRKPTGVESWVQLLTHNKQKNPITEPAQPLRISVCIAHYNRGDMLLRAIESILNQSVSCEEIIVVDDASTDQHTLEILSSLETLSAKIEIKLIRQPKLFIGASRNAGLREAKGEYILFMDDDNQAMQDELKIFSHCAVESGADILTCLSEVFTGDNPEDAELGRQHALFIGPNVNTCLFSNPFGDSNMFAKVESLRKIQGFSEHYKVGLDDQELFVRASKRGLKLELVPKALFFYRISKNRIRQSHINDYGGAARVLSTYSQHYNFNEAQMLAYAQGLSYASGPWGSNIKIALITRKFREQARIYAARFPSLYNSLMRLRRKLNGH